MILTHLVLFGFWTGAGGTVTPPATPAATPTAGRPKKDRKKRWWKVGERVYHATPEQIGEVWDAYLAQRAGEAAPIPKLKSKPAERREQQRADVLASPLLDIPEIQDLRMDWEDFTARGDYEAALVLLEAVQRRMAEDEEDIEMILLSIH